MISDDFWRFLTIFDLQNSNWRSTRCVKILVKQGHYFINNKNLHYRSWTMLGFDTSNVHLVEFTFFLIKNSDNYRRCALRDRYFIWYKSFDIFELWLEFVYEEGFWDWRTEYFVIHLMISMRHFYLENSDNFK